jgi:hypothetical protein
MNKNKSGWGKFWKAFNFLAANAAIFYLYAKRKEHNLKAAGQPIPAYYKTALYFRMVASTLRIFWAICFLGGLAMLLRIFAPDMTDGWYPDEDLPMCAFSFLLMSSCVCFLARLIDMFRQKLSPETEPVKSRKLIMDAWCFPAKLLYGFMWKCCCFVWKSIRSSP